jgi:flagellar biosynthesis/type III secretory pathway M-ring protein FliF/YscJ
MVEFNYTSLIWEESRMQHVLMFLMFMVFANLAVMVLRSRTRSGDKKDPTEEREENANRHDDLVRKLDNEQEDAAKKVELKNKTLELYDQVRQDHEDNDNDSDEGDE